MGWEWIIALDKFTLYMVISQVLDGIFTCHFEPTGANGTVGSYTSLSVCLSVCLDVCHSTKNQTGPKFITHCLHKPSHQVVTNLGNKCRWAHLSVKLYI